MGVWHTHAMLDDPHPEEKTGMSHNLEHESFIAAIFI
jgi:hypothetical protein